MLPAGAKNGVIIFWEKKCSINFIICGSKGRSGADNSK
jgi:hypothetical protein